MFFLKRRGQKHPNVKPFFRAKSCSAPLSVAKNLDEVWPRTRNGIGRKHTPEAIIGKLRAAEIALAQGRTCAEAHRRIGVTELRDDRRRT
ncbi:hypothetical protein [Sandarakinorhabdus limnophila]|uniref:hypothetical protein n=1 Tax=Sandarakinorhabdus limnophila TaxID=210512 RepID=UPI0026EB39B2|nr:hypothetical protein [Sandarakinorhabdus limnophila]